MFTQFNWGTPLRMKNSLSAVPERCYQLLASNGDSVTLRFTVFLFCLKLPCFFVCGAIVNMVSHQTNILFLVVFQHESHNIRAGEMEKLPPISTNSLQIILLVELRAHCSDNRKACLCYIVFSWKHEQLTGRVFCSWALQQCILNSCNIFWNICSSICYMS